MCGCGAQEHGLVMDLAVLGLWLHFMILKVFSDLNVSMTFGQSSCSRT